MSLKDIHPLRCDTHTHTHTHIHTREYHSAKKKKKNEIMPLEATWMVLHIIILSEVNQSKKAISFDSTYMRNLKKIIQRIYLQNRDSQT